MKKLAIFDFDGTLFNSIDDVMICFNRTLESYNLPALTREEYIPCLGGDIDDITYKVLNVNTNNHDHESFKKSYLELYNSSKKDKTIPFKGTHELLEKLQQKNVLLSVNSNRMSYSLNEFVTRYFKDIDFIAVEGHSSSTPPKPDPAGALKIIEKAGADLSDAIYIGDSITDIKTAENAGIDCIIVDWGYANRDVFENDYILGIVKTPLEILDYF